MKTDTSKRTNQVKKTVASVYPGFGFTAHFDPKDVGKIGTDAWQWSA